MVSSTLPTSCEYLIAGAGLAGATAAFRLGAKHEVCLIDPTDATGGASAAAAGLINPFMGRKANPTWRCHEALNAVNRLVADAEAEHAIRRSGVFRPARSEKQVTFFKEQVDAFPELTEWLDEGTASERFPWVEAPYGGLFIPRGGSVDVVALLKQIVRRFQANGHSYNEGWCLTSYESSNTKVEAMVTDGDESRKVTAERLLLCVGQGFALIEQLRRIGLRAVKGQTIIAETDKNVLDSPALSGYGYVVPTSPTRCIIGSTYEHEFEDLEPSAEQNAYLLEKAGKMIGALATAEVVEMRAGARVFPPSSHLPWVGPLDSNEIVWFFGALGSRGLLTAPLISAELGGYMHGEEDVPGTICLSTS